MTTNSRNVITRVVVGAMLLASGTLLGARGQQPVGRSTHPDPPIPRGLIPVFWPEENPYSPEKAELGRLLFFDTRLSSDNSVSCASCHDPSRAFADRQAVSSGIGGQKGRRNAPALINRAFTSRQFWDGRSATLEEQAVGPLANRLEMTSDGDLDSAHRSVVRRIREIPGYRERFRAVFGDSEITLESIARAIATFERTIYSGNSAYDRFQAGDRAALTESQKRGLALFTGKAGCNACHHGFNLTNEAFVNIGIGYDTSTGSFADLGRFLITRAEFAKGAFKTPTLREVANTAPYMHDGSLETLEAVVDHYDRGGRPNPYQDPRLKPLHLSTQEKADLIAFLNALNGEGWQHITSPLPNEFPR